MELTREQQELVELATRVPPADVPTAKRVLEALICADPVWHSLANAPLDDEELRPEIMESIEEARASIAKGEGIPHEEILREFGLG
jgi:hypothetical protein